MNKEVSTEVITTYLDKQVSKDLGDKKDLEQLSVNIPHATSKYLRMLHDQGLVHLKLDAEWKVLYRDKFELYRYNFKYVLNKAESEIFINADEDILILKSKLDKSELILNHLESIVKMLGQTSFNVRNALEFRKMENGYM